MTFNGAQLDQKWTKSGPQMDRKWTKNGTEVDRKGTESGLECEGSVTFYLKIYLIQATLFVCQFTSITHQKTAYSSLIVCAPLRVNKSVI